MTFRVWYKNGTARLVTASDAKEARGIAKELAEVAATDLSIAYGKAKATNPDRAKELAAEYVGCTVITKVEPLS